MMPGVPVVESPLFYGIIEELGLNAEERRVAVELHERGYAVIDFPDEQLDERIARIQTDLGPKFDVDMSDPGTVKNSGKVQRIQDAWAFNENVRAIAANANVLDLLGKLYGRPAFPFQTLNFPVGTQQPLHSDSIHFSSVPERFMCGVWLAMEDIDTDAGPLTYLPGSHKWPILRNSMIARRGWGSSRESAQDPFQAAIEALVSACGIPQELFLAKKGKALIWSANLLHGGSPQLDQTLTRWSQVTHYYFDDCSYFTPAFSDEELGKLDLRSVVDVTTGEIKTNKYLGEPLMPAPRPPSFMGRIRNIIRGTWRLPHDFSSAAYHLLNPDVALLGMDARTHYLTKGKREGRKYKLGPAQRSDSSLAE
jgi:hypothetical protein